MRGAEPCIVAGEEQRHGGDIGRLDPPGEALRRDDLGLAFGRIPFALARGLDIARDDRVDADVVAPQLARQAARQALDPPPPARIAGMAARAAKNWCFRLTAIRSSQ